MARTDPVSHLHRFESGVPAKLRAEIVALGPAAIPALERLVTAERALESGTPDQIAAANAIGPYVELTGLEGLPRLVRLVLTAPLDGPLQASAMMGILAMTDHNAVTEVLLAAPTTEEREPYLVELMARGRTRHPSVARRIAGVLHGNPRLGAQLAALSGDPVLLPAVRATFDALPLSGRLDDWEADTAMLVFEAVVTLAGADNRPDLGRQTRLRAALELSILRHEQDLSRR